LYNLQSQTQALLEEAAVSVPASYFPFLAALDRLGPLSVSELAEAIGITQPGVTRVLDKLQSEGLVQSRQDQFIGAAVADACAGPAASLLAQFTALEEALAAAPLSARARRSRAKGAAHARP
jgi:predicted transcriptional regulator